MGLGSARKVAVVTGGTRGIGLEIVRALVEQGFAVIATGRAPPQEGLPGDATFFACNVTSDAEVAALAEHVSQKHGGLDALVNNAGLGHFASFGPPKVNNDPFAVMDVNFRGAVLCGEVLLPLLVARGRIVRYGRQRGLGWSRLARRNWTS